MHAPAGERTRMARHDIEPLAFIGAMSTPMRGVAFTAGGA
jgi:hypothetical protein